MNSENNNDNDAFSKFNTDLTTTSTATSEIKTTTDENVVDESIVPEGKKPLDWILEHATPDKNDHDKLLVKMNNATYWISLIYDANKNIDDKHIIIYPSCKKIHITSLLTLIKGRHSPYDSETMTHPKKYRNFKLVLQKALESPIIDPKTKDVTIMKDLIVDKLLEFTQKNLSPETYIEVLKCILKITGELDSRVEVENKVQTIVITNKDNIKTVDSEIDKYISQVDKNNNGDDNDSNNK